jgi:hypothetical protein
MCPALILEYERRKSRRENMLSAARYTDIYHIVKHFYWSVANIREYYTGTAQSPGRIVAETPALRDLTGPDTNTLLSASR